jgi:hypothetical protein
LLTLFTSSSVALSREQPFRLEDVLPHAVLPLAVGLSLLITLFSQGLVDPP